MATEANPVWWIELIKVSPGLIAAIVATALIFIYRADFRALLSRTTKFKALGVEAEFSSRELEKATVAKQLTISHDEKQSVVRRLQLVGSLLRDASVLWVDDHPESTRHERALLDSYGARVTTVKTSAEGEQALRENLYALVITDLNREGSPTEGLNFVRQTVEARTYRPTIAYTSTDQAGQVRPAHLFAITNRPDELFHYICDIIERERL